MVVRKKNSKKIAVGLPGYIFPYMWRFLFFGRLVGKHITILPWIPSGGDSTIDRTKKKHIGMSMLLSKWIITLIEVGCGYVPYNRWNKPTYQLVTIVINFYGRHPSMCASVGITESPVQAVGKKNVARKSWDPTKKKLNCFGRFASTAWTHSFFLGSLYQFEIIRSTAILCTCCTS